MLTLLSIVIMTLDHRFHHMQSVRSALGIAVYPIQYAVNLPVAIGHWLGETLASRGTLIEENHELKTRQLTLNARLQTLEALEAENARLRSLLDSSSKIQKDVLIAELLTADMAPFSRQIVLNKGSSDGVFIGQPILDADGIMGQIIAVTPFTSAAILITDPNHAIPIEINRNGLRLIAVGTGDADRLDISNIPNNSDIAVGDLLVSSGLGGRFPAGYPVARVIEIEIIPGQPFAKAIAKPTADIESTREMLLVWTNDEARPGAASSAPDAPVNGGATP